MLEMFLSNVVGLEIWAGVGGDPHCQPRVLRQGFSYEFKGQSAGLVAWWLSYKPSLVFAPLSGEHRGAPRRREHTREEGGPDLRHDG